MKTLNEKITAGYQKEAALFQDLLNAWIWNGTT